MISKGSEAANKPRIIKICLYGDDNVGKSNLLSKFVSNNFTENYVKTIGIDFLVKKLAISEETVKLQVWDTAGDKRFCTITQAYVRGSEAVIIVFDLTNSNSYENAKSYHLENIRANGKEGLPIILVGNKCDLVDKRQVEEETVQEFVRDKSNGISAYFETSAKAGINVQHIFQTAAVKALLAQEKPKFFAGHSVDQGSSIESMRLLFSESKVSPSPPFVPAESILTSAELQSNDPTLRTVLILRLEKYIARIDKYRHELGEEDGYSSGFWFFKESRASNRQANHQLAKKLLNELTASNGSSASINEILNNALQEEESGMINSTELNEVIEIANYSLKPQF